MSKDDYGYFVANSVLIYADCYMVDACYSNTFLSAPTSRRMWKMSLVQDG